MNVARFQPVDRAIEHAQRFRVIAGGLLKYLERTTNRLAFALVPAALVVASALLIHAGVPPGWHGISIIGLLGYTFAGLTGATLLISTLCHGRM